MYDVLDGFKYDNIHTREYAMRLIDRNVPSPTEKEIIENIPFMQGTLDFSMMLGERVYENRPLTYVFEIYERKRETRKVSDTVLKNWLIRKGILPLYDDYDRGYYWLAKCTGVNITDDHRGGRLIIEITFDAYPLKKAQREEGHDIWDEFNFDLDLSQDVEFTVDNTRVVTLINSGSAGVSPAILADGDFTIIKNNITYHINSGETKSEMFRLEIGENKLTINGNGTIKFIFYKELI
ncbi:MAG: phage tail family protein [Bacillaceae bacterium]|nr:phage tail family protein [Bacillaceae bacterium]